MLDVVIVGGSSAGSSAALILGRSLREVVVIDDHKPCNRFSHASHGFLTRDGVSPSELIQIVYDQLERYPTVVRKTATTLSIEKNETGFEITSSDVSKLQARIVLLATGLHDELPPLDGIGGLRRKVYSTAPTAIVTKSGAKQFRFTAWTRWRFICCCCCATGRTISLFATHSCFTRWKFHRAAVPSG